MACFSQNLIPVHIAFIPILIPALLKVLTELKVIADLSHVLLHLD